LETIDLDETIETKRNKKISHRRAMVYSNFSVSRVYESKKENKQLDNVRGKSVTLLYL
jgi:hypothetical protein